MSADHVVVMLLTGEVSPLELSAAAEIFGYRYRPDPEPWYDFRLASVDATPVPAMGGFSVMAPYSLDELAVADTVMVVPNADRTAVPDPVIEALRAAHTRGARMVSICAGAFVLAAAGLLEGRRATTHWWYTDELARSHPGVAVQRDVLYVDDGDILSSAGSAAGIDLCLHLVRLDHGAAIANAVARALVVPPHRDGSQAQYAGRPHRPDPPGRGLAELLGWAADHLDQDLSVCVLAERAAMSPRTFARRFRQEIGTTPHQWVMIQRVDRARQLLEATERSVDRIAIEVGFASAQSLRARFKEVMGITPADYRRAHRAPHDRTDRPDEPLPTA
ncbi:MAG: helix-turn-helix domain-containing protein [Actinomycetota bacterium]|nr:helix-turn-helix domain-containing protein [Actinomycetota bacterium]